ncbi:MAG: CheY-like chemotaxis protein [Arenicella sp.]|jgi:CheY-like chemotaxis protein
MNTTELSTLKVLLCENHEVNILLNEKIVSRFGVQLVIARNGKEGVQLAKEFSPDIILMDLQMPEMDGYSATEKIRKFTNTPIYAMSSHVLDAERKRCDLIGMNGFITKPFKESDLKNILSIVANKRENKIGQNKWTELDMPGLTALADGDSDFVNSLFEIYLKNTNEEFDKIKNAKGQDEEIIKRSVHKMKPSFITFNLNELYEFAQKIENGEASEEELAYFLNQLASSLNSIENKRKNFNL